MPARKIFISYSTRNVDFARYVRSLLQDAGFDVWMEETKLSMGQSWTDTLEANVTNCSAFVIIMSPESKASDWVRRERLLAEKLRKPIFPILYSGEAWWDLANIQYEDMRAGLKATLSPRIIDALQRAIDGEMMVAGIEASGQYTPPPPQTDSHKLEASIEQKTVFISYRRDAAAFIARSIFLELREHGYDVFMDVESIDAGQFEQIIFNQIEARAHFLIILTPGTVERYANNNDMMRREIEFAMDKQRNIVPLLLNNFSFREAQPYLTGKLAKLEGFSGVAVPHDYFEAAMERVRTRFLKQPISGAIKPAPASDQAVVKRKIEQATQPVLTGKRLSAEDYFNSADQKWIAGDFDGVIADCTAAIQLKPDFAEAYNRRGTALGEQDNLDSAIADFTEAIRLNPQFAEAYNSRGIIYETRGDLKGAIADYQKYLDLGGGKRDSDQAEIEQIIRNLQDRLNSQP